MLITYRASFAIAFLNTLTIGPAEEPVAPVPAWPALEWRTGAPSPLARVESPSVVVQGRLYLFGGSTDTLDSSNEVDVYDPAILIVGGRCNHSQPPRNVVGGLLEYDPKADAWRVVGALPGAVLAPAAGIISGRVVVTGGGLNNPRPLTAATWIALL